MNDVKLVEALETGTVKIIKDLLPRLSELVVKDEDVKVMLNLSRYHISFFKREAKRQLVPH